MSGNRAGGLKTVKTIKASHGEDWYAKIGKLGGAAGTGHKFAHGKISAAEAGKLGRGTPRWSTERRAAHSQFMKDHWKARQPFVADNSEFGDGLLEPSWKDRMLNKIRRQDV